MITLTKAQFTALRPCYPEDRLALWGDAESLNVEQALTRGYAVSDVLWVAGELDLKRQCVIFGVRCARLVLHLNPDPRVRAAIDVAQAWVDNPCAIDAADAADAGDAARASAPTAYADAYAAFDADAYAASDAAYAAGDAAYAAGDAAYATSDADADAAAYSARAARAAARIADFVARASADGDDAIKTILIDVFSQQSVD